MSFIKERLLTNGGILDTSLRDLFIPKAFERLYNKDNFVQIWYNDNDYIINMKTKNGVFYLDSGMKSKITVPLVVNHKSMGIVYDGNLEDFLIEMNYYVDPCVWKKVFEVRNNNVLI